MKILILADPSSAHTIRWVNSLSQKGIEIFLFGLSNYDATQYDNGIKIESFKTPDNIKAKLNGSATKSIYLFAFPRLKKIIKQFNPDILHSHYAASYGLLGSLAGFHPHIVSVWGIDILKFPEISFLHKKIISFTLSKADGILATGKYLAQETKKYTNKIITVIPFGIDTDLFRPKNNISEDEIVIGTVKSMERKYGIEYLIESFAILKNKYPEMKLKLLLVGGGSLESKFQQMIYDFGISESSEMTGHIPFNEIVNYQNKISIAVYVSNVESFGVSVLESSACEIPVVVSNSGGLPEVVSNGITGIVVRVNNINETVLAIEKLILSKELRRILGKAARERVIERFNWENSVSDMINYYNNTVKNYI